MSFKIGAPAINGITFPILASFATRRDGLPKSIPRRACRNFTRNYAAPAGWSEAAATEAGNVPLWSIADRRSAMALPPAIGFRIYEYDPTNHARGANHSAAANQDRRSSAAPA